MMGGVCGHAGVFSTAHDLAKLMQMYLNKGTYGGEQYIKSSTMDLFTSCPFCSEHNRRGIGFDKPDLSIKNGPTCLCVSPKTFGHQGFTGCVTWADPESGLLYIFLSNRINPDANNTKIIELSVRTRIQEALAKATIRPGSAPAGDCFLSRRIPSAASRCSAGSKGAVRNSLAPSRSARMTTSGRVVGSSPTTAMDEFWEAR